MDLFGMMRDQQREPVDIDSKIFTFDKKCIVIPQAKGRKGKKVVCGLVFANWCGHCNTLKPKWAQMYKNIRHKVKKNQYYEPMFAPFEEGKVEVLREFNQRNAPYLDNETVQYSGYPTLFKIANGKISYYEGERETEPMERWFMSESMRKGTSRRTRTKHRKQKPMNNRTRNSRRNLGSPQ